ncbi:glycosyltransferase family A protein [Parasphingorhabdus sp.]|jgi:glycosyltransferase involved in cell wall biosynthesis|uniref:glycosyltransferase family 2 protein n=1 Tax=Parasphingorhabdus sp. TaxID=2709688 RepID=UPI0032EEAB62
MQSNPLVSVGMPVKNGGAMFKRALDSVLNQNYEHLEIIISDNASTDETAAIATAAAASDLRVRYHRQQPNLSATNNFLFCVDQAQGEFFMWAAHDDLRSADFVSSLLGAFEDEDVVLAFPDLFVTSQYGASPEHVVYDFENRGLGLGARLRKQALMQCRHIYGLWRADTLRSLPRVHTRWWGDIPIMMCAVARGTFAHIPGAQFVYLEVFKSDAERAKYQDGVSDSSKLQKVALLIHTSYVVLRPLVGRAYAFIGAVFVAEKVLKMATGFIKRRAVRWWA